MKIGQINAYQRNNGVDSKNVGFGKVIEIEKAIVDGIESSELIDFSEMTRGLGDILLKVKDSPNAESIRTLVAKVTGDYKIPESRINNSENPTVEMHMREGKKYFATGEEAKGFFEIGYWRWKINHEVLHGRMPESCLKDIEPDGALDKAIDKIVGLPEAAMPNNEKLVLYGKRVPIEDGFIKSITGRETKVELTDINFTA